MNVFYTELMCLCEIISRLNSKSFMDLKLGMLRTVSTPFAIFY